MSSSLVFSLSVLGNWNHSNVHLWMPFYKAASLSARTLHPNSSNLEWLLFSFLFLFYNFGLPLMSVFLTRWIQPSKNSIWPCLAFTFWGLKDEPSDVCAYNEALKEILKCKWNQHMWSDVLSFVTPCLLNEKLQIFLTLWCFYISYYDTTKILSEPSVILVISQSVSVTSTDFSRLFL